MASDAFRKLSATGMFVLLRFLQKRSWTKMKATKSSKKRVIYHDYDLTFTYAEANALGISTSQFHVVIKKLIELGFIDVEHQGGGVGRDCSKYALSGRWKDYGAAFFEKVEKPKRIWRGRDVRSNMERLEKTTGNRSCGFRKRVVISENGSVQGSGSS